MAFRPIREFIVEESGITLKSDHEEKKYLWEELKESYLTKKEVRGAGGREHRTLILKTPDKNYSFESRKGDKSNFNAVSDDRLGL